MKSKIQELRSKYLTEKNVLGLEVLLAIVSIASMTFLAYTAGDMSKFLLLPASAILLVPFFSTLAFYRGFKRTALGTILLLVLLPMIIIGGSVVLYLPSRAGGLVVVLAVVYSSIATAVLPYVIFAIVLGVHYYRENFQGEI